jgi:hypothetical protein
MTWKCISPEVTVKGFKKCYIFNAVGETDDDMLWNDSDEDGNVWSECEEDEGTDCEDCDRAQTGKGKYNLRCFVY